MPMTMSTRVRRLSQSEFGELAYDVMGCVFALHDELGRLFDETLYKRELGLIAIRGCSERSPLLSGTHPSPQPTTWT